MLIVHPGSGTVIDAEDGVLLVDMLGAEKNLTDEDILFYALRHGVPFPGKDGE